VIPNADRAGLRRGITLTEILISILILGVGLVSLATLFPIGLLRLREAQRQTRSAYLYESAAADVAARGLLKTGSFAYADLLNTFPPNNFNSWYYSANMNGGTGGYYDPLVQDRAAYNLDPFDTTSLGFGASSPASGGYGLPFAYDPLWRWQTDHANGGIYLYDTNNPDYNPTPGVTPEARFAAGDALRTLTPNDNDGNGPPSAYGLQRLTNFNRPTYINSLGNLIPAVMPAANFVSTIFVSPEDFVWQEATNTNHVYTIGGVPGGTPVLSPPSPVVPDLNTPSSLGQPNNDWRFTWMLTAQQNNASNGASFDGNIVVFENRPFSLDAISVAGTTVYQAAGETVAEGIFGYSVSKNVVPAPGYSYGYGAGADRTVLIRWNGSTQADPVVKVGDFIADVTYERIQNTVTLRFLSFNGGGVPNMLNNGEWDNLPAQRCYWYQVQKITPAQIDPSLGTPYRSMVVYVNRKLEARTLMNPTTGNPVYMNAVLVCPYVVNVIPQTFFVR
jgi:type II secretory pathway pseudopilin PulG